MKHYLVLLMLLPLLLFAGYLELQLSFDEDAASGFVSAPGRRRVPVQSVNVLLPAGSELLDYQLVFSAEVSARGSYSELNPGWYNGSRVINAERSGYTPSGHSFMGIRKWGDLTYASFQILPYDAERGTWYQSASLSLSYQSAKHARKLIPNTFNNPGFFVNQSKLKQWYQSSDHRNYDYLVVSTPALYAQLGDLTAYRQTQGMALQFANITDILISELGATDAEKLRNYLITQYAMHPFTYLLLVGDSDTVPVAYLTPEPGGTETVPSDFFFGDLSSNWDTNGNGLYGEYYSTVNEGDWQVDYTPEVFVGRISTNNPAEVATIASRIVSFDSSNAAFKQKALLPAAFLNYADEPEIGMPQTDGADFFELTQNTALRNYDCDTMYEQFGVVPSYPSDYPLDQTNFNTLLRGTDYGLINWSAHGSSTSSSRKVWAEDDGNNIPEYTEMQWMNLVNKQSFNDITANGGSVIFAASCYNGYIDGNDSSLAEYALIKKAVGVLAATRTGWYKVGWQNPGWGGLSSYNYHFLENYAEAGHSLGAAHAYANLTHTQYYLFGDPIDTGGIIWPELQNVYTYLLYGDPAVGHNAIDAPQAEILVYIPTGDADYRLINAIRETADINVVHSNRLIPDYDYLNQFEAIFCVMDDYQLSTWETALLDGYLNSGGKLYLEGSINWDMSDVFLSKFGVEAPLDNVITIEGLAHQQQAWGYNAIAGDYRVLVPMGGNSETIIWTDNTLETEHSIGVLNQTDQYATLASSFHLNEVLDSGANTFQELVAVILSELSVISGGTSNADNQVPQAMPALSAWPNPSAGRLSIKLENPDRVEREITIYNIRGQKVHSLQLSGKNSFTETWDGKDTRGQSCPAGVYILKSGSLSRKISLLP